MELTFLGAAGEVTGSSYLLKVGSSRVLVDCGMFQGPPEAARKNWRPLAFDPRTLDAVVLTHAHIDHSGRLPILTNDGYRRRVYTTPPTVALCDILLKDAARLQAQEVERLNRHRERRHGKVGLMPLFDERDVGELLRRMSVVRYDQPVNIAPGVTIRFRDAGHILGSGMVEAVCQEGGRTITVVFSGDLGERGMPLMRDPQGPTKADVVIMESTYGDRDHKSLEVSKNELRDAINDAAGCRGMILIPAFAVGRTQTLIYELNELLHAGEIKPLPVFIDSPMGVAATRLYETHRELFDEAALAYLSQGCNPLRFPTLKLVTSSDESRALNQVPGPAIIIAGAGMCNGGRIMHHLRHHLYKDTTHVIIPGFQAEGTLGRRLVNGEKIVRIFGEPVMVKAKVHTIGGLSAHAGQTTLLDWFAGVARSRPALYLTHGENGPRAALAAKVNERFGVKATLPMLGDTVSL
jgi:metallo-beta-lactamase family protein